MKLSEITNGFTNERPGSFTIAGFTHHRRMLSLQLCTSERGTTRERCKPISAIRISSRPCDIPSYRRDFQRFLAKLTPRLIQSCKD
jgi:hypothetical protein